MSRFSHIRTIYYRGSLNSCNYTCSYCAFGRKGQQGFNVSQEVKALEGLCDQIAKDFTYPLRIMLIPYGEGMIHPWFRQQMIRLATLPQVEGISCQTNLSFPVDTFLKEIRTAGVSPDKIKCWCSFHPEMVKVEDFVRKTETLLAGGIEICAGTVGDPSNKQILRRLRNELPLHVYMFINAMEGKKTALSKREIAFFSAIDNLFPYDRSRVAADWEACRGGKESRYVDFRGDIYPCPRSRARMGNLYGDNPAQPTSCGKSICDCYIAYSNLDHTPLHSYMGQGITWRIPERKPVRAMFFDIDGTLVPANKKIPERYLETLKSFAGKVPLFLATALPVEYAKKRLGTWFDLFFRWYICRWGAYSV
ncbi:MAG: STM4011 family radical SAM protein [Tannerellaceae bacterium]|nr:STM4011 family radical SAM protein [Tannerellaceae bacterium]